jgi:hypothetical protein
VVEGAEQQHDIHAAVRYTEPAGVSELCGDAGQRRRGLDMVGYHVDHVHAVAVGGQPRRVHAGATAHIEYLCWRLWQRPAEQLLRA